MMKIPKRVWLVTSEVWDGNTYNTVIDGVFANKEAADLNAKLWQGNSNKPDVQHFVNDYELCMDEVTQ